MALILAPYNNGMRIGQGFNSYTQRICIDDAVVLDPLREDNVVNNTGMTMKEQAESHMKSLHEQPDETVADALSIVTSIPPPTIRKSAPRQKNTEFVDATEEEVNRKHEANLEAHQGEKEPQDGDPAVPDVSSDENIDMEANEEEGQGDVAPAIDADDEVAQKDADAGEASTDAEAQEEATFAASAEQRTTVSERAIADVGKTDASEKDGTADGKTDVKTGTQKKPPTKAQAAKDARNEKAFSSAAKVSDQPDAQEWRQLVDLAQKNKNTKIYEFKERDGPSQIVVWTSKFVSKISDITDDMNISGSLSIKAGTIGGSGRGSFVDASKFQESDLNFYISVKVINQSINFKDCLKFQPLKENIKLTDNEFTKVFGDSFISGFLEGGELNGLVSMKVLNNAKKTDIAVAAKVALTCGAAEVSAEAQVDIAKQNLHENTETTVQVSWSGGGHIKPRDQPWDIDALIAAAARFPDLVARTPQRTYAILTKYESLRSFQEIKGSEKKLTPLQYENASLYTNAMLDAYMEYKAMYRTVSDQIFEIENDIRKFSVIPNPKDGKRNVSGLIGNGNTGDPTEVPDTKKIEISGNKEEEDTDETANAAEEQSLTADSEAKKLSEQTVDLSVYDEVSFPKTLRGMDRARVEIRKQMSYIVSEVDEITNNPTNALDVHRKQPFQGPVTFRTRIPKTEFVNPASNVPLSLQKIAVMQAEAKNVDLYPKEKGVLEGDAKTNVDQILKRDPAISLNFRMDKAEGSHTGEVFNDLVILRPEFMIRNVEVQIYNGMLGALRIRYTNGVSVVHGCFRDDLKEENKFINLKPHKKEVIMACAIETGTPYEIKKDGQWVKFTRPAEKESSTEAKEEEPVAVVTSLRLYTNRGQVLKGEANDITLGMRESERGNVRFKELNDMDFDPILNKGHIKGFWGWSRDGPSGGPRDVVYALAPVWGCPSTD